jgi:hypothetical protein
MEVGRIELSMKRSLPRFGTAFALLVEKAQSCGGRVRQWFRERKTETEFAALDDRTLAEIGFHRVRLRPDHAIIVPMLDEVALRVSSAGSNDNASARREVDAPRPVASNATPAAAAGRGAGVPPQLAA